jgi:hypothetical protein
MSAFKSDDFSRFRSFIEASKTVLLKDISFSPTTTELIEQNFLIFINAAKILLVKDIRQSLSENLSLIKNLRRWLIPSKYDLLTIAQLTGFEDPYTELISWMLYPPERPDIALRCQRVFLTRLGLRDLGTKLDQPVRPVTQFITETSRPDLVMRFEKLGFLLVLEAKTDSAEHETPNGKMQTHAYPDDVRNKLFLSSDYDVKIVFLTRNGEQAANPEAILITYGDIVYSLALELRPDELPEDLRWIYATVFTHFFTHAAPDYADIAHAIRRVCEFDGDCRMELADRTVLADLASFRALTKLFSREIAT